MENPKDSSLMVLGSARKRMKTKNSELKYRKKSIKSQELERNPNAPLNSRLVFGLPQFKKSKGNRGYNAFALETVGMNMGGRIPTPIPCFH